MPLQFAEWRKPGSSGLHARAQHDEKQKKQKDKVMKRAAVQAKAKLFLSFLCKYFSSNTPFPYNLRTGVKLQQRIENVNMGMSRKLL